MTHTFEFGDGSTLTTLDHSRLVPTETPGVNQFRPSRVITGGTGIFEGAAGRLGTIAGEDNFINLFSQSAVWSLRGAIAVPPLVAGEANGGLGPRPADGTTFTVTSTADSGPGSLRDAIIDANASTGLDTLVFDIGAGLQVISPLSPLPAITDPIIIDAMPHVARDGSPRVVLDGTNAGPGAAGLYISAGHSTVRGLAVGNFDADGVVLSSHGANVLEGNYIGVDANGSLPMPNGRSGVFIMNSTGNRVGGISPQQRNIISANHGAGDRNAWWRDGR